jgi:hypothetical protein
MSKRASFESEYSSNDEEEDTKEKRNQEDSPQSQTPNYDLIRAISITLTSILDTNKNLDDYKEIIRSQSRQVFSATIIPAISIRDYLIRIQTYSNIEKSTLIICLIYIDRFCNKAKVTLTYYNIHRILFSAILMSIKYNEDSFYDNKYYSQIAGVKVKELQILEYNFIKLLNCELYVSRELYDKYQVYLENFKFDEDDK